MATILRPRKTKQLIREMGFFIIASVIFGGYFIFEYADHASARHSIEAARVSLATLKEESAFLKQDYFTLTDPLRLREIAEREGMVLERRPLYLTYQR